MTVEATFIDYNEKQYEIEGKTQTGRYLQVKVGEQQITFKGVNISRELTAPVFAQYQTGDKVVLDCDIVEKEYANKYNAEQKVKVPTLVVVSIESK